MSKGARTAALAAALAASVAFGAAYAAADDAARDGDGTEAGQEAEARKPAWLRKLDRFLDAIGVQKTGPVRGGNADDIPDCIKAQMAGYPVGCGSVD